MSFRVPALPRRATRMMVFVGAQSCCASTTAGVKGAARLRPYKNGRNLLLQLREALRRFFPFGGGGGQLIHDNAQLTVEMLRLAGLGVRFGRFECRGQFVLLRFEF